MSFEQFNYVNYLTNNWLNVKYLQGGRNCKIQMHIFAS
jgi:hypothetical protein